MGRDKEQAASVVAKRDITVPLRTGLTCERVIDTEKSVGKGPYQVTPVEKYSSEEEEVILREAVMKGTGNLSILRANTRNKTIKILIGEE